MAAANEHPEPSDESPPGSLEVEVSPEVEIDPELWHSIARRTRRDVDRGEDPEVAFWSWVFQYVEVTPDLHVDGEPVGLEDALRQADDP